jgi:hypothetical protein
MRSSNDSPARVHHAARRCRRVGASVARCRACAAAWLAYSSPARPRCDCGPHRNAGQMRWTILDLGEMSCLIDVSKLNPGPSGEDADAIGQPRDVGSPCASTRSTTSGALSEFPRQNRSAPLAHMQPRHAAPGAFSLHIGLGVLIAGLLISFSVCRVSDSSTVFTVLSQFTSPACVIDPGAGG